MPKISFADLMADWDRLLANGRDHVEDFDILGPLLDDLQARRQRMDELYQRRQVLRAETQLATQEMDRLREEGKDKAMQARDLLRSKFGINSPRLKAFNLRPRGKYKKRKKGSEGEASAPGDTTTPA